MIYPLEGTVEARAVAIDPRWYTTLANRPAGIAFLVRVRDEEATLRESLQSIKRTLDGSGVAYQIVLIDNASVDATPRIAREELDATRDRYIRYPFQLAKPGVENHVTPTNSAHSLAWFYEFCLVQCRTYSHVMKWDGDFVLTPQLASELKKRFGTPGVSPDFRAPYTAHAVDSDGLVNGEPYIYPVAIAPYYIKCWLWELIAYATKDPAAPIEALPSSTPIVHVSTLKTHKRYYKLSPWWETTQGVAEAAADGTDSDDDDDDKCAWRRTMVAEYERIKASLPPGTQMYTRAMDPTFEVIGHACAYVNEPIVGLSEGDVQRWVRSGAALAASSTAATGPLDYATIMTKIYDEQVWNGANSRIPRSGPGSALGNTTGVRRFFDEQLDEYDVRSVLDIGCGDMTWMSRTAVATRADVSYVGVDVVASVVAENRQQHGAWATFVQRDVVKDGLPPANSGDDGDPTDVDLIVCRDVMMLMATADILRLLRHMRTARARYVMLTSFPARDIDNHRAPRNQSHFRPINIALPPFAFDTARAALTIDEPVFHRHVYVFHKRDFDEFVDEATDTTSNAPASATTTTTTTTTISAPMTYGKIPRIVHQIWVGDKPFPERYAAYHERWKALMPHWQVRLWTNDDITRDNFALYDHITQCERAVYKADMMRYEILQRHGGIYLDVDMRPVRSLDALLDEHADAELIVSREEADEEKLFVIGMIAAVPQHAALRRVVDALRGTTVETLQSSAANFTTGPRRWSANVDVREPHVVALPHTQFYSLPYEHGMAAPSDDWQPTPDAYAVHEWAQQWWT